MAHRRVGCARRGDGLGPSGGGLCDRNLGRLDDRRALRHRRTALVHGRPLAWRDFQRRARRQGRPAATADRAAGARFELERTWPPIGPGSWQLALRTLLNPRRYTPATVFSGWLWRGVFSTEPLKETIRRVVPSGWSPHPNLWIVACDYETGRRTPFGRIDAPRADLADAVAASCAIPGIYHPVTIGDRRFVDGGIYSVSNLDLLRNEGLDLVICLNPTSTLHPIRAINPRDAVTIFFRRASGRRLGSEAKKIRTQRRRRCPHSAHGR